MEDILNTPYKRIAEKLNRRKKLTLVDKYKNLPLLEQAFIAGSALMAIIISLTSCVPAGITNKNGSHVVTRSNNIIVIAACDSPSPRQIFNGTIIDNNHGQLTQLSEVNGLPVGHFIRYTLQGRKGATIVVYSNLGVSEETNTPQPSYTFKRGDHGYIKVCSARAEIAGNEQEVDVNIVVDDSGITTPTPTR